MASIHDFSCGDFSIEKRFNAETEKEEPCLTRGPEVIHGTFSEGLLAREPASLKERRIVLIENEDSVVVKVDELARVLNIDEPSLEGLLPESGIVDVRNLRELALSTDIYRIDQSYFKELSPCTIHNEEIRLSLAKKLINAGRERYVVNNLEKLCFDDNKKLEVARLLLEQGESGAIFSKAKEFSISGIAELLIENIRVSVFVRMFDRFNFDAGEKSEIAKLLISKGEKHTVTDNLKKFGYTVEMAKLLIEQEEYGNVTNNLEKFGYTVEMAKLLIEKGEGYIVMARFERFNFDDGKKLEIVDFLIAKGKFINITDNIEKFNLDDDKKLGIAKLLIEQKEERAVVENFEKFGYYGAEVLEFLLGRKFKEDLGKLADNLEKFDLDDGRKLELAKLLLEKGEISAVTDNLEKFGYNKELGESLKQYGAFEAVISNLENFGFSTAEKKEIIKFVIENGGVDIVIKNVTVDEEDFELAKIAAEYYLGNLDDIVTKFCISVDKVAELKEILDSRIVFTDLISLLDERPRLESSLNTGAFVQGLNGGFLSERAMNIKLLSTEISPFYRIDFKLTRDARDTLESTVEELIKREGIHAQPTSYFYKGVTDDKSLRTVCFGSAKEITLPGLGRVVINNKDYIALHRRISIEIEKTDDGVEDAEKLNKILSSLGLESLCLQGSEIQEKNIKLMTLFRTFFPSAASRFERGNNLSMMNHIELKQKIISNCPGMKKFFENYRDGDELKKVEVYPGKEVYADPHMAERLHKAGARAFFAGIMKNEGPPEEKANLVEKIMRSGLMSTQARLDAGNLVSGTSPERDHLYGAAGHSFLRTMTSIEDGSLDSTLEISKVPFGGEMQVLCDLETASPASGAYAYYTDTYGSKAPGTYISRRTLESTTKMIVTGGGLSKALSNEIMIKDRVPTGRIKGFVVREEAEREAIVAKLTAEGYVVDGKVNGVPIEKFVQVASRFGEIDTQYCS